MARQRITLTCAIAAIAVVAITESSHAQFGKRRNQSMFNSCAIRPDALRSSLGVGFAGGGIGVRPNTPSFASPNSFVGTRVLSFGNRFGGNNLGRSFCNPRPACFAPTFNNYYYDSSPWDYPSNNLGHCNSGSFYNYRSLSVSSGPSYSVQPLNAVVPSTLPLPPPATATGWNSSGDRQPGTDRAISAALADYKRNRVDTAAPPPPQSAKALSDTEVKELETLLDKGDDHFGKGRYGDARDEYTRALVIGGNDPGVRIPFGMTEFALGRFADASRAMRQAAAGESPFDPDSIDVRQAYDKPGEFDAHVAKLEHFVAAHPFDADGLFLLGFIKACSGNPVGATAVFEKYLALRDADPSVRPFIERVGGSN